MPTQFTLRQIAVALCGNVSAGQVVAPGPGHSRSDRSMTVRLSPNAPDGFVVFSHAGDDFAVCKDYVRSRLGIGRDEREGIAALAEPIAGATSTADALAVWDASINPRGTPAEVYLNGRALVLGDDIAHQVLRWNPRIGALVALFRNIGTDAPQAVSRIFLRRDGSKRERKFLGPVRGAAVKLDSDDAVTSGLHVAEGVETGIAARQLGLRPTWALGSTVNIEALPVLSGVECLTILAENDSASERAAHACGTRWHQAGREVWINQPIAGKDLNDAIRGVA